MTFSFKNLRYREKQLYIELGWYIAVTVFFFAAIKFHGLAHAALPKYLAFTILLPTFLELALIHSADDRRTDERDKVIKASGERSAYRWLLGGVYLIVALNQGTASHIIDELFALWMVSRIVRNARQLRLYGGHEGWLPDRVLTSFREYIRKKKEERFPWKRDSGESSR